MSTAIRRSNGQVIVFDSAENVVRDFPSDVTQHPIETGSTITDHIVSQPREVQVTALLSDAAFRQREEDSLQLGPGRAKAGLDALTEIRDNREVFLLETSDEIFSDMVFTDFRIPRDSSTGDSARITFVAKQVSTVERQFALIPANADPDSQDAATADLQTGQQAPTEVEDQSALSQLIEFTVEQKDILGHIEAP